jgi:branched-chain amino acid transport system substrate-binding protein
MKKGSLFFVMGIALMIFGFVSLPQAAEPIKIGYVHSLSGAGSVYGKPCLDAAEIAVAEINAKGGVLGRKLQIIARDDKTKPDDGLREAKDLVLSRKVNFLMGTVSSAVALAISGFAKEQKKLFVVATAQSTAITTEKGHRYIFRISTNNSAYCRSAARRAAELPFTKYYLLGPDYEYGHSSNKEFWTELKKLKPNVELVKEAFSPLGTPDFKPYISAILASGAEASYSSLWGGDWISFAKQGKAMGYFEKVKDIGQDHGNIEASLALGKEMPEGILAGSHYPFWALKTKKSQEFVDKFRDKTGMYPGVGAAGGYVIVNCLAQAMTKAKSVDVEKVIDALETVSVDTPVGNIMIRKIDHQSMWPFWFGFTKFTPQYPDFAVLEDIKAYDPPIVYQSEEEVKALRAKQ